jgi:hypothetical protein
LLHDNARSHTAVRSVRLLREFKWQFFDHALCSPDLTSANLHKLLHVKTSPGSQNFADSQELNSAVEHWRQRSVMGGIQQLVPATINTSITLATVYKNSVL